MLVPWRADLPNLGQLEVEHFGPDVYLMLSEGTNAQDLTPRMEISPWPKNKQTKNGSV